MDGPLVLLRVESTDAEASILQQRLSELRTTIAYQEEQHGPTLVVCLRFEAAQENAVRRVLGSTDRGFLNFLPLTAGRGRIY